MGITGPLPSHIASKIADPAEKKRQGKAAWTVQETLDANCVRDEKADHNRLLGFLSRNELENIHAPTFRRVHDLPPGWPDFTVVYGPVHLFIELKACGGRLSNVQKAMKAKLESQGARVHVRYSYEAARNLIIAWLWETAKWRPLDPE